MQKITALLILILCGSPLWAEAPALQYQTVKGPREVLTVTAPGQAAMFTNYMPYLEWKKSQSGQFFPMEVTPVVTGLVAGGVPMPPPKGVDPSQYKDQAAEFAKVVNFRNQGGRHEEHHEDDKPGTPEQRLQAEQTATYVVQSAFSTVIDRPLNQMQLSTEKLAALAESIDVDHFHFRIPGTFVLEALDKDHIAGRSVDPKKTYLLSVVDFRDYGCAALKNGIRDYFSRRADKDQLMNESMYLISDLDMNNPSELAQAAKYFGRKPDALLTQRLLFADHLVRGAETQFFFFSAGEKTQIVLLSNIALKSKFFTGTQGALTRQFILNGIGGGVPGAILDAKDKLTDLLQGATNDVNQKNSCDRGLAQGLIRYFQSLFTQYAEFISKT